MQNLKFNLLFLVLGLLITSCIERYTPPAIQSVNSYLVVDGFINAGTGPTIFNLTRTRNLSESFNPVVESNASVWVEGENGESYQLRENKPGEYSIEPLTLNPTTNYRVRIRTNDSKEYLSAFVPVIQTPAIDSITWRQVNNGVQININTHDPNNNTWFYKWNFQETWEYRSAYISGLVYRNKNIEVRNIDELIYTCWQTANSTGIFLGSSAQLNEDIIYQTPLTIVPPTSKLSIKYSILVKQYGMSEEGFQYWQLLKKNTETTGSIFDAQPSQLTGNITCVNNPQEPVIGFISASSVQEKRIFINRRQLRLDRLTTGYESCRIDTIEASPDVIESAFAGTVAIPLDGIYSMTGRLLGYTLSSSYCVDCREAGGTTIKPDFWE